MKEYKKRAMRRWWNRHYKGWSDLYGIMCFLLGAPVFCSGVMLVFCREYYSIIICLLGFALIWCGCELIALGRR